MTFPTIMGMGLALSGLPVVMANLLSPSPVFGDHPVLGLRRILFGLGVSSTGLYYLLG